ncbi:MAG: gamma-glutamyltransferase family protein [Thermomicrobiales bacterium]
MNDNMIVCPEPLAAQAGQEIFAAGGNAADAAVAAAFAQGVTNPLLCGIGGTGLFLYHDGRAGRTTVLNCEVSIGSRPAPDHWQGEYGGRAETIGRYILASEANQVGHQSVMIPGFVRGCWTAFQRFGSGALSWDDLLAPAIRLARDGFAVYPYIAPFWRVESAGDTGVLRPGYPGLMTKLAATADAGRIYLKADGTPYAAGDWFVQADYARTLARLAEAGGGDFYNGEIARRIVADFDDHHGLFTAEDLRDYTVEEQEPLHATYRGYRLITTPPSSPGCQLIEMLKILEHFAVGDLGHNSADYVDLFARIQRAGFADNAQLKGTSSEAGRAIATHVMSDERAAWWAERIRRGERVVVRDGASVPGTTHVTAVDRIRNVVSFTHSIGSNAGAGVVTPGLGFLFNNFLGHYNPVPGQPDSIAPGKRLSGVLPAIVFRGETPYVALGAPGGSRIITAVAQAIANVLDFDMGMDAAVRAPRFHSEEEQLLFVEPAFPDAVVAALATKWNEVQRGTYMSRVQAIRIADTGHLEAGADPRGGAGVGRWP